MKIYCIYIYGGALYVKTPSTVANKKHHVSTTQTIKVWEISWVMFFKKNLSN